MIDHRLTDYDPGCLKTDGDTLSEKFEDGREFMYIETYTLVRDGQRSYIRPFGLRPVEITGSCRKLMDCCKAAERSLFEKGRHRTRALIETYKKRKAPQDVVLQGENQQKRKNQ